jgi:hypothetical protein
MNVDAFNTLIYVEECFDEGLWAINYVCRNVEWVMFLWYFKWIKITCYIKKNMKSIKYIELHKSVKVWIQIM